MGSGAGGSLSAAMVTGLSSPAVTMPRTTAAPTAAARASSAIVRGAPSCNAATTRLRAAVSLNPAGSNSAKTKAGTGLGGSKAFGTDSDMRSTAPSGLSVYCAVQAMKRRRPSVKGGASKRPVISFSFADATSPLPSPHTTPVAVRAPSGAATMSPSASARPAGTR